MKLPYALRSRATAFLGFIPTRIRSGPNRGLRWSLVSSGRGYGSGDFEARRIQTLEALVEPGDVVWDVGAHQGYVTMALSRCVGPQGQVVAIEPSRSNLALLRRHVRWNRLENVHIVDAAAGDQAGLQPFGGRRSSLTFSLGPGSEEVRVVTLLSLAERGTYPRPRVLKVDAEGAGAGVLRGAEHLLSTDVVLLVSLHSRSAYEDCRDLLAERGFRLHRSVGLEVMLADLPANSEWTDDPDLLAVGADHPLCERAIRRLPLFSR